MSWLLSEFRRRNVFRVAALYLVCAWLIAQVADVVIGLGELPPSVGRAVLIILAMGFPASIAASWFFEWTPEGIRRDPGPEAQHSDRPLRHRLDYVIIALLSTALVYFIATHDWGGLPPDAGASVAVLPFENRSALPDDLYFTDGIHEDILTQLGKISSMLVISRTSVMRYRDSGKSIPEIASELGVATLLEGGVQRAGDRVRINVQLIEAASDKHLWAETYDRELTADNVFAIQSEIAAAIADSLRAELLPAERRSIATAPTHNLGAYDAYLLGRRQLATRRVEGLVKAREYFQQAIQADPGFAVAYTGLADTMVLLSEYPGSDSHMLLEEAEGAARKALELNPVLGEAHTSLGLVLSYKGEPPEEYAPYLRRGVELAPGSADARKWYSNYLGRSNRNEEALEQLDKAVRLDPMSPIIRVNLAHALRLANRVEESLNHLRRALEIDPRFHPALQEFRQYGPAEEVIMALSRASQEQNSDPWVILDLAMYYLTLGDDKRSEAWAAYLDRVAPGSVQAQIVRLNIALFRSDHAAVVESALRLLPLEEGMTVPSRSLLVEDLRRGHPETAMARYEEAHPELLGDDPQVGENYALAIDVAMLFQATGAPEKADRLLERSVEFLRVHVGESLLDQGIFLARALALRGSKEEALDALRRAIDAGWRRQWWFHLKQDPAFDSIRNEDRFRSMLEMISAETASQLEKVRQLEASGMIVLPPGSPAS